MSIEDAGYIKVCFTAVYWVLGGDYWLVGLAWIGLAGSWRRW